MDEQNLMCIAEIHDLLVQLRACLLYTSPKAPAGLAAALAQKLGCVVLLSGTEDLIADGQQLCTVRGGSDRMRTVTGEMCIRDRQMPAAAFRFFVILKKEYSI